MLWMLRRVREQTELLSIFKTHKQMTFILAFKMHKKISLVPLCHILGRIKNGHMASFPFLWKGA